MLPRTRQEEGIYPIPQFSVEREDVEGFMEELREFYGVFRECFARSEPRENAFRYLEGRFSGLERKTIEPIALHEEGANVRRMQSAITDAHWDENRMLRTYRELVNEDMGDPDGVLIVDESGFRKKGNESAGVQRQYCGTVGKVDNCQVGVFAGYASRYGYALIDKRLFIPEAWFDEEHAGKREKDNFPLGLEFKTKPQLASEMVEVILHEGELPVRYVVADSLYGESEYFLHAMESHVGITYLVGVASDTLCWPKEHPAMEKRTYRYHGKSLSREIVAGMEMEPVSVRDIARMIPDVFWYRRKVSEGTKGSIEYEFTRRLVSLSKDGLPSRTAWLVIRRSLDKKDYWFFISNAPRSTRMEVFVWLSGIRWAIEQSFEEAKGEVGMDQYEVRKYPAWNHHMLISMLAHFFLWHVRIRLGKKSTTYYSSASEDAPFSGLAYENTEHAGAYQLGHVDRNQKPPGLPVS
jgi:SRSO17 transposase